MGESYFNKLNYTLSNEDTTLELGVLPERTRHVAAVAGSGARVLPLFARHPEIVTCSDRSPAQLALTRLRVESVRALSWQDFLTFWGYPARDGDTLRPEERKAVFESLTLPDEARASLLPHFEETAWDSILYSGSWETAMGSLARLVTRVMGKPARAFFECRTPEEASSFLARSFPHLRWSLLVALLGNASVFNALLYKGRHPRKNVHETYYGYYRRGFDQLFRQAPARQNFFLQLIMLGRLEFAEGLPLEADPAIFEAMQAGIRAAEIRYVEGDVLDTVALATPAVGLVSLSDVGSYFDRRTESEFLQRLGPGLEPGGRVVCRYYFRIPEDLDTAGFDDATGGFSDLIAAERTQVYRIHVWQRKKGTT